MIDVLITNEVSDDGLIKVLEDKGIKIEIAR